MKPAVRISVAAIAALVLFAEAHAQAQGKKLLRQFENAFIEISDDVRPSVVEISAESTVTEDDRQRLNDLFRFFGRPEGDERGEGDRGEPDTPQPGPRSTASGFIYDRLGHIVTNNHVVKDAQNITVELWDGTVAEAEVVGQDPESDLAVIKIDPNGMDLRPVHLGDSGSLRVGQFAIAMGSPSGLTGSFSYGHVTGLGRESLQLPDLELRFQEFIQTDAAINLGNSGGPLCNIDGEVIGVNVAIVFRANSIGFAIPVNRVKEVVPELVTKGRVVRGWLGVSVNDVEDFALAENQEVADFIDAHELPDKYGSYVRGVTTDGPAEKAGLQADDVIREIDGKRIEDSTSLINTVSAMNPGDVAQVKIWRRGQPMELDVEIGEFPGRTAAIFGRDYLGMHITELTLNPEFMEERGMDEAPAEFYVAAVVPDSPADEAGIRRGDVVMEIAYEDTTSIARFKKVVREKAQPGKTLLVKVWTLTEEEPRKVYLKVPEDFDPSSLD